MCRFGDSGQKLGGKKNGNQDRKTRFPALWRPPHFLFLRPTNTRHTPGGLVENRLTVFIVSLKNHLKMIISGWGEGELKIEPPSFSRSPAAVLVVATRLVTPPPPKTVLLGEDRSHFLTLAGRGFRGPGLFAGSLAGLLEAEMRNGVVTVLHFVRRQS